MRFRLRPLVLSALLLLAAAPAAAEDVIVLMNGREVRGKIVEEREELVKIDVGGGKMTYRRDQIREVRREKAAPAGGEAGSPAGPETPFEAVAKREEPAVLYIDGERAGTRVLRTTKLADGWLFEEETRLLDEAGKPRLEIRTTERSDLQFRPVSFQVRETDGAAIHRSISGEVSAGLLRLTFARNGAREKRDLAAPADARFPCAAREMFLRESKALGGKLDTPVFDLKTGVADRSSWREAPPRPLRIEGRSLEARVVVRERGGVASREWLDRDGTIVFAELEGGKSVAVACTLDAVERLRAGDTDRVTGADSAGRSVYADKVRGWKIGKPDPTWTFEKPANAGPAALLVVRNEPLFATVDVTIDPDARPRVTLREAADALERLCLAIAPDFQVAKHGTIERDGILVWWMEATATTKGEKTRTLARVVVKGGRAYRVLAACPEAVFASLRPELESILDSFRVD